MKIKPIHLNINILVTEMSDSEFSSDSESSYAPTSHSDSYSSDSSDSFDSDKIPTDCIKVKGKHIVTFDRDHEDHTTYFREGTFTLGYDYWLIKPFSPSSFKGIRYETGLANNYPAAVDTNDEYLVVLFGHIVYIYQKKDLHNLDPEPCVSIDLLEIIVVEDYDYQLLVCSDLIYVKHNIHGAALILKFQFDGNLVEVFYTANGDYSMTNYKDQCLLYGVRRNPGVGRRESTYWNDYKLVENDNEYIFDATFKLPCYTGHEDLYPGRCDQLYTHYEGQEIDEILVKYFINEPYPAIHIPLGCNIVYATDEEIYVEELKDSGNVIRKFPLNPYKKE